MWLRTVQVCQYPRVATDFKCIVKTMGPYLRYRHAECARLCDSAATSQINTARLIHNFAHLIDTPNAKHTSPILILSQIDPASG